MSMANRNDSDVRQHETLPGPGPGPSSSLPAGARPVEQVMDAAIERIAREQALSAGSGRTGSEPAFPLALPMQPTRLRWKGLDVSEEFKAYAERVARGEDLPPFEGRVLAEPNPAFPWGPSSTAALPPAKGGAPRAALWGSAVVVLALLGWSVGMKLEAESRDAEASSAALERAFAAAPAGVEDTPSSAHTSTNDDVPHDVVETQVAARTAATEPDTAELGAAAEPSSGEPAVEDGDGARNLAALDTVSADSVLPNSLAPDVARFAPAAGTASLGTSVSGVSSGAAAAPAVVARSPVVSPAFGAPAAAQTSTGPVSAAPSVASVAPRAAVGEPARAAGPKPIEEDFGIEPAPAAVRSAPAAGASVGDLARVSQGSGANVRKEPGSESSAKGSLLVENPSF
jgi:hypothetical protein